MNDFMVRKMTWKEFAVSFTYNTNKIEGSKLSFDDVKTIIYKNIIPINADRNDIEECYGLYNAINAIKLLATSTNIILSPAFIKEIHYMVFLKTKPFAGKFREKPAENVVIVNNYGNILATPPSSEKVVSEITDLCNTTNILNENKDEPFKFHIGFENIHPFMDGNGRVGRLLLNLMLLQRKMNPIDIEFENRLIYYSCLEMPSEDYIKALKKLYEKEQVEILIPKPQ